MMTPQEVAQHAFTKATFGGYNMTQVDDFLDTLTEDYSALYKDNAVLKSKMKVLVDKIDEYRATEDAMRSALLTAQKMANSMVAEAEEKKAQLLRDAETAARQRMNELKAEIQQEETRLAVARRSCQDYVNQLGRLLADQQRFLERLPETVALPVEEVQEAAPAAAQPSPMQEVEDAARAIEDSMQRILSDDLTDEISADQEPLPTPAGVDLSVREDDLVDDSPTRRIDFDNLQFGRDYDID